MSAKSAVVSFVIIAIMSCREMLMMQIVLKVSQDTIFTVLSAAINVIAQIYMENKYEIC